MPTYCKSVDKKGRILYWRIQRNGKLKRVSKKTALKSGVVLDCVMQAQEPKFGLGDLPQEVLELISSQGLTFEDMARLGLTSKRLERAFPPAFLKEKKRKVKKKAGKGSIYLLRIHVPEDPELYEYKAYIVRSALEFALYAAGATTSQVLRILSGEDVLIRSRGYEDDKSYALTKVRCDNLKGFLKSPEMTARYPEWD